MTKFKARVGGKMVTIHLPDTFEEAEAWIRERIDGEYDYVPTEGLSTEYWIGCLWWELGDHTFEMVAEVLKKIGFVQRENGRWYRDPPGSNREL